MSSESTDGPPRAALIASLIVAVGGLVAVLVVAAVLQRTPEPQPVAIAGIPAPRAESPQCRALVDALPDQLGDYRRAALLEPAPPGTAAWQREEPGSEALILRCGLDRPAEFVAGAPVQVVDAVEWFRVGEAGAGNDRVGEAGAGNDRVGEAGAGNDRVGEAGADDPAGERSTWFAVDRPVYVALTIPADSGPTPIQTLSKIIADTLQSRPPDPAPIG
ncbi:MULTISPECIES: DUF3515 domain-containing protein [Mycolicibacterium]|uniref:DUF3515 domain-containing protein n=1 Tax=Mycolicibacterium TaxID=1866885 RepID=UPI0005629D5E|nr:MULTISPECIES: DUF3515 domain-containing protein [Mycolicibacterium]QZY48200.1 DUF3515 domain-containing protein [Mycolicibacterium austroafricanum]UJL26710.1 DUF3515 domain-containing protein [Mycolicibacterium vanbaalenii]WND58822.1 DUF3515 domain-containing protein [Mycolicibacterium vanbaalenii]